MNPKAFILFVMIAVGGVIYYKERSKQPSDRPQTNEVLKNYVPKDPSPTPVSSGDETSSPQDPAQDDFEADTSATTSNSIPISQAEKEKEKELVQEALKNSPPPTPVEMPKEKGKPWINEYEIDLPSN